jgi:hypothetical protein
MRKIRDTARLWDNTSTRDLILQFTSFLTKLPEKKRVLFQKQAKKMKGMLRQEINILTALGLFQ